MLRSTLSQVYQRLLSIVSADPSTLEQVFPYIAPTVGRMEPLNAMAHIMALGNSSEVSPAMVNGVVDALVFQITALRLDRERAKVGGLGASPTSPAPPTTTTTTSSTMADCDSKKMVISSSNTNSNGDDL